MTLDPKIYEDFRAIAQHYGVSFDLLSQEIDKAFPSLPVAARNALQRDGIVYVGELVQQDRASLLRTPVLGVRRVDEIIEALSSKGLSASMYPDKPEQNRRNEAYRQAFVQRQAEAEEAQRQKAEKAAARATAQKTTRLELEKKWPDLAPEQRPLAERVYKVNVQTMVKAGVALTEPGNLPEPLESNVRKIASATATLAKKNL